MGLLVIDAPHWDARFPESVSMIRNRGDLTERAKSKILGENAARPYGLNGAPAPKQAVDGAHAEATGSRSRESGREGRGK